MRAGLGAVVLWTGAFVLCDGSTLWAQQQADGPSDWELATVVAGKDRAKDVETKLGHSPCLLPSSSGDTLSYLYNVAGKEGPLYLRLTVTNHVTLMTLSKDPPIAGVCYGPVHQAILPRTGRGLQLGATTDHVTSLYGRPAERFSVGPMTRFRYVAIAGRHCEWDLVFRNDRLVEWTVVMEE